MVTCCKICWCCRITPGIGGPCGGPALGGSRGRGWGWPWGKGPMNPCCPAAGGAGCCCPPWCWWAWLLALALACIPETIVVRARESSCQSLCVLLFMINLENGLGRDQTAYLGILESAPSWHVPRTHQSDWQMHARGTFL